MEWVIILNSFMCVNLLAIGWYSIKTYTKRLIRLEKRMIELSLRYTELIDNLSKNSQGNRKPLRVSYMEGSLDMVHKNKTATVKAVFHPRKTIID